MKYTVCKTSAIKYRVSNSSLYLELLYIIKISDISRYQE